MAEAKKVAGGASGAAEEPALTEAAKSTDPADIPHREEVFAPGSEDDGVGDIDADDYTKDELQEQARDRGLDDSGTKAELTERINKHDDASVYKPEVLYPREEE